VAEQRAVYRVNVALVEGADLAAVGFAEHLTVLDPGKAASLHFVLNSVSHCLLLYGQDRLCPTELHAADLV